MVFIFRASNPDTQNVCANCAEERTCGCWRKGWVVGQEEEGIHAYANLCNR